MKGALKHLGSLLRFNQSSAQQSSTLSTVEWQVTNQCNARCQTCLHWQKKPAPAVLSTSQGKQVIKTLAASGIRDLCFTGGEPMLRKDLFDFLELAHSVGIRTSLISNALLINERKANRLIEAQLDTIYVSIDAAEPKLNDKLRGIDGYFNLALKAIDSLKSLRMNSSPNIILKATISNLNAGQLLRLAEMCRDLDLDGFSFQLARHQEDYGFKLGENLRIDDMGKSTFLQQVNTLLADYSEILTGSYKYYKALQKYFADTQRDLEFRSFDSAPIIQIDPWANVYLNHDRSDRLGNVLEDSFIDIRAAIVKKLISERNDPLQLQDAVHKMNVDNSDLNVKRFFKIAKPLFNGAKLF